MKVQWHEGLHRFFVQGNGTDPDMQDLPYLVDLAANGAIGFCGCKHWEYRISPRIAEGEHPVDLDDDLFTCGHIRAARRYQFDQFKLVPEAAPFSYDDIFWRLMELEPHEFM